ncbi:MAG: hypothetical protein B7C24_15545 [Bacteroidetes bacterium 4572_77]|nr:MAG: hypothetical protein B7C24_15545 [Bacteroidetes bacterium 4572_77]
MINRKINILIISTYYPPTISIASNRMLALSKYLDKDKFNVTVLTQGEEHAYKAPEGVKVWRIKSKNIFKRLTFNKSQPFLIHKSKAAYNTLLALLVSDEWKAWRMAAINFIDKEYPKDAFDFVVSSFPPVAPHLIALQLKKKSFTFKWIADMRDEMSENHSFSSRQRASFKKTEKLVFENAMAVSSAVSSINENFKKQANGRLDTFEMKNGFDFNLPEKLERNKVFTISHVGTFYGLQKPDILLKVLADLLIQGEIANVKLRFVGSSIPLNIPTILKDKLLVLPKIEHKEAIEYIKSSDANFFILSPHFSGALPGKIFEYMASLRPIIGVFQSKGNSQLQEVLNKSGLAVFSEFDDLEALKKNILSVYRNWQDQIFPVPDKTHIASFHRKNQIKIMEAYMLNKYD